jgi:hypothetical protein
MKKLAVFAVMGLVLTGAAFAETLVLQDGVTKSYEQNNVVNISGKTSASVSIKGVRIFVPKGKKVQISSGMDGHILITGSSLEGVELFNGQKFIKLSSGKGVSVAPDTLAVTDLSGNVVTKEQTAQQAKKQSSQATKEVKGTKSQASDTQEIVILEISDYVNDVVTQQSSQDIERPYLSPSSAR